MLNSRAMAITGAAFAGPNGVVPTPFLSGPWPAAEAGRALPSYNVGGLLPERGIRYLSCATRLFCTTAMHAIESGQGQAIIQRSPERIGVYHGAESPHLEDVFRFDLAAKYEGPESVSPMLSPNTLPNAAAGELAIRLDLRGANVTITCGHNSGLQALDLAYLHLGVGEVDYAVLGSVEVSSIYHRALFERAHRNGAPARCPELGVVFCLETAEQARRDGRAALALVVGSASNGARRGASDEAALLASIQQALDDAGLAAAELDAIVVGSDRSFTAAGFRPLFTASGREPPQVVSLVERCGRTENSIGLLGVSWVIAAYQAHARGEPWAEAEALGSGDSSSLRRVAVASLDRHGCTVAAILERPETTS
ncbi:MAG: beta-ketoacyl synthase N-terminal-like domain-containing protein [Deltaproteobacteria bacterium]